MEKIGREENNLKIALAEFKRNRVYMLFGLAKVEQCNVTFAQTESILNGTVASNISTSDVETVINLKRAHAFLAEKLAKRAFKPDLKTLCDLHNLVVAGETSTVEPEKIEAEVKEAIKTFTQSDKKYSDGIALFCELTRIQAFFDGNKRTALLFANALLSSEGVNPLTIPVDKMPEFNEAVGEIFQDNCAPMQSLLSAEYHKAYPDTLGTL